MRPLRQRFCRRGPPRRGVRLQRHPGHGTVRRESGVGATRWVARRGRGGRAPGMMRSHDDRIDPHPALRAGLSLAGRGVFSLPCNCDVQTVTPSHQATSTPLPRPG